MRGMTDDRTAAVRATAGRRYLDTLKTQEERLSVIGRSEQALADEIAARRNVAEEIARGLSL